MSSAITRSALRSERMRAFRGHLVMLIESLKCWQTITDDPLAWLLEFSEHEKFFSAFQACYVAKFDSIYLEQATEERIRCIASSLDVVTFKHVLVTGRVDILAGKDKSKTSAPIDVKEMVEQAKIQFPTEVDAESKQIVSNVDLVETTTPTSNPLQSSGKEEAETWTNLEQEILLNNISKNFNFDKDELFDKTCRTENTTGELFSTVVGRDLVPPISTEMKEIALQNNVYEYGERLYAHLDAVGEEKKFPVVIYAGPGSGKSTANELLFGNEARDTDTMLYWGLKYSPIVMTNMSQYIKRGKVSIAVLPDLPTFKIRCEARGLKPLNSWYNDILENAKHATHLIRTNDFVADALLKQPDILNKCRETVGSPPENQKDAMVKWLRRRALVP